MKLKYKRNSSQQKYLQKQGATQRTSTAISMSSGSGLEVIKYATCSNTCSLDKNKINFPRFVPLRERSFLPLCSIHFAMLRVTSKLFQILQKVNKKFHQ